MPAEVSAQRLLEPGEAEGSNARARRIASDTLKHWLASTISSKASPTARAPPDRGDILGQVRLADLDLGAAEARRLRRHVCSNQRRDGQLQPAALGRYSGTAAARRPRPATAEPRRLAFRSHSAVSTPEREAGDRADGGRVRREEEVLPESPRSRGNSRPTSRGARWSRSSATTDEPPVPMCSSSRCPPRRRRSGCAAAASPRDEGLEWRRCARPSARGRPAGFSTDSMTDIATCRR